MVVWAGPDVRDLAVGDKVAIEPGVPCEKCLQCSSGAYNLCTEVRFSGAPPHHGSIRRYHVHPSRYLHKIPESMSFSDGALLEPLSVVMHAFERSPVKLGESAVICGAGPIGLIALAVARASGACPLLITDVDPGRLEFAQKFLPGCLTEQVQMDKTPQEMAALVIKKLQQHGGEQPRVVYECTGVQSSVVTAAYTPRPGGEIMVVGVGRPILDQLPFMHLSLAEVSFVNSSSLVPLKRNLYLVRECRNRADLVPLRSISSLSTATIIHGHQRSGCWPPDISTLGPL